jgi:hypothetical protein
VIAKTQITRRRFVAAAAGITGSVVFAGARPWRVLVRSVDASPGVRLASLFSDRESARAVGDAYLEGVPEGPTVPELVDQVAAGVPGGRSTVEHAHASDLRRLIAMRIRADFSEGHVVDVGGWILSSTEVRLYAIAALV